MSFDPPLPGRPDFAGVGDSKTDHFDAEIVFESSDGGRSWDAVQALPNLSGPVTEVCRWTLPF